MATQLAPEPVRFGTDPLPCPPAWARARVDEICGGGDLTDDMPMVAFLRLAEYVAEQEGRARLLASVGEVSRG